MATINLNIYSKDNKNKVAKVLKVDGYDLMMGTVEDFVSIIDVDKINDKIEVTKMVLKGFDQIKPLLMDIFPDLTAEDFRNIKVNELVVTITQIGRAVVDSMGVLKSEKN